MRITGAMMALLGLAGSVANAESLCSNVIGEHVGTQAAGSCIRVQGIDADTSGGLVERFKRALPFALGSVHIVGPFSTESVAEKHGSFGPGWLFTAIRTTLFRMADMPQSPVWLQDGGVYTGKVVGDEPQEITATLVQFDPVSVGIMATAIVVWIIAPYIANKGVFSFAIFFLAIIMVASTAALFMLQRLTDPTTLVVGAVGLVAVAASAIGLPVSPSTLALQAVSKLLLASGFFTAEQADNPETVATVLVVVATMTICCIGLFAVFYIPATAERLQSFSFVIRFGTLFIAPLAGSSPDAMLVCGCAPLALQLAGMVVALFVAIEYFARQLAAAVLWLVSVLCCPCIRCTQCLYRCCYADSGAGDDGEDRFNIQADPAQGESRAQAVAVAPPDSPRSDYGRRAGPGRGRSSSTTRVRRRPARAVMSSHQAEITGAEQTAKALGDLKAELDDQPELFAGHVTEETAARLGHFAITGEDVLAEEYQAFDRDVAAGRMNVGYLRRQDISQAELEEAMAREETAAMRWRRNPGSFR